MSQKAIQVVEKRRMSQKAIQVVEKWRMNQKHAGSHLVVDVLRPVKR